MTRAPKIRDKDFFLFKERAVWSSLARNILSSGLN